MARLSTDCRALMALVIFAMFVPLSEEAARSDDVTRRFSGRLYPYCVSGKWGYINGSGLVVIEPRFDWARDFSEGLAVVQENRKTGCIDASGKLLFPIPLGSRAFGDFSNGRAVYSFGNKFGYIDPHGSIAVTPQYDSAQGFAEGLAAVNLGAKSLEFPRRSAIGGAWGYIDLHGRLVIRPVFRDAGRFSEGKARVRDEDGFAYIDRYGKILFRPVFESLDGKRFVSSAGIFAEGLARIETSSDVGAFSGFVGKTGAFVVPPQFHNSRDFKEGLAAVAIDDRYGFINQCGLMVIRAAFSEAGDFNEGLARIRCGDYWGYIDKQGKLRIWSRECAIGLGYNDADDFTGELARVHVGGVFETARDGPARWTGGAWFYVNQLGCLVKRCRYDTEAGPGFGGESK